LDDASLDHFYRTTYQTMYARAPVLETYFSNQTGYGERVLALYQAELPGGGKVLEVGCGAGGGLAAFQRRGYSVAGCELSRELIEFGQGQGVEHLWHGTIDEAPSALRSMRFDLVMLHHVFEHVQSPRATLESLAERLAPGGRVLTIVPDITRIDRFANPNGDALRFLHVAHKFNYTTACLEQVAAEAGLAARAVEPPPHLKTVWSEMPELWVEFQPAAAGSRPPALPPDGGQRVLGHLKQTEERFLAGEFTPPNKPEFASRPERSIWKWLRRRPFRRAA
jgi:SAM-dependent methyltransferase